MALQSKGNSLPPPTRNTVQAVHTVCPSQISDPDEIMLDFIPSYHTSNIISIYRSSFTATSLWRTTTPSFDVSYRVHVGDDIGQAHRLRPRHPPPHQ
ncbi:unnamed protein product [Arctia plantaginis]|uniref:Uncharacterized protein n=1 Tax=Arctia plantaginis TaxID=874455 RepID=A0A8S1A9J5_ARCPL|nr:unnamed protein product [Arctia plantaginis]